MHKTAWTELLNTFECLLVTPEQLHRPEIPFAGRSLTMEARQAAALVIMLQQNQSRQHPRYAARS